MRLSLEKEAFFPNLRPDNYRVTSNEDSIYNCIAHAAGRDDAWWWPVDGIDGVVWPADAALEETLECFVSAYGLQGYALCDGADREPGFEKVALYIDAQGSPSHAARQLPTGTWTSKLGDWEDIEHDTLNALEDAHGMGLAYGQVAVILKRRLEVPD